MRKNIYYLAKRKGPAGYFVKFLHLLPLPGGAETAAASRAACSTKKRPILCGRGGDSS